MLNSDYMILLSQLSHDHIVVYICLIIVDQIECLLAFRSYPTGRAGRGKLANALLSLHLSRRLNRLLHILFTHRNNI